MTMTGEVKGTAVILIQHPDSDELSVLKKDLY